MKRIISLVLVIVLCLGLCVPAMAATTEKVDITYRAIKIVLNGTEITPCDAAGKTVEPFIMNSNGTTYLPLRAIGQALGLDVKWTPATNTVELTSGGAVKTGDDPAGTTTGTKKVDITYRDIKVVLDGTELELKNALGESVEPFILNSNSSVYLPLRVVGEAFGLTVKWEASTSTVYLDKPAAETEPLTITKQPVDAECSAGESVYFVVEVSGGKAPYTYQWMYKDDGCEWEECNATRHHSGVATATLTVTPDDFYMTYHSASHCKYYCVITDAEGNKVESDAVSVIEKTAAETEPLTITKQPVDVICSVGDTASFSVEVSGGKAPYSYQWQARGVGEFKNLRNGSGATLELTTTEDVFNVRSRSFISEVQCVITDADGNTVTSKAVKLVKAKAPALTVTTQPEDVYTSKNGSSAFTAVYTVAVSGGTAPYTYQWQYGKTSGNGWTDFSGSENWANPGTIKSATLLIGSSQGGMLTAGYIFRCVITDANGEKVYSDAASLNKSITIVSQPETIEGAGSLKVVVEGGKAPYKYQWQMDGPTTGFYPITNGDSGITGYDTDTLTVTKPRDDCFYRCIITDANGVEVVSDKATVCRKLTVNIRNLGISRGEGTAYPHYEYQITILGGVAPFTYKVGEDDVTNYLYRERETSVELTWKEFSVYVTDGRGVTAVGTYR